MDSLQELQEELRALSSKYGDIQQDTLEIKQKLSKLSGAKSELGDLRQENGELRRKLSSLQSSAIEFYRLMERTLSHPDLDEEYYKATKKFLSSFERYLCPHLGLTRISPRAGEPFQDQLHQAVGDEPWLSATDEFVRGCISWGFRIANWEDAGVPETIKPAQVIITTLPEDALETSSSNVTKAEIQPDVDSSNLQQGSSVAQDKSKEQEGQVNKAEESVEAHESSSSNAKSNEDHSLIAGIPII